MRSGSHHHRPEHVVLERLSDARHVGLRVAELVPVQDAVVLRVPGPGVGNVGVDELVDLLDDLLLLGAVERAVVFLEQLVDARVLEAGDVVVGGEVGEVGAPGGLGVGEESEVQAWKWRVNWRSSIFLIKVEPSISSRLNLIPAAW